MPGLSLGAIIALASALSAVLIIALRPLLVRYALARPNARSSHTMPTPQGGGIAVVAATLVGVLIAAPMAAAGRDMLGEFWPVALAVTLLAVVGAVDDIKNIPVVPRLILQFVAVGTVVAMLPTDASIVPLLPVWLERVLLVIAGVYAVNLVNFMDGIDWMSVAEVLPIAAGILIIGWIGAAPSLAVITAAALAGGMIGFAPFNRPVAKLFLGDVGSLPIGLLLFWLMLQLAIRGQLAAALLLPLYYLADATITLARRFADGHNILQAHRTHFYQRALDKGWAVLDVVGRVFVLNLFLALLATATVVFPSLPAQVGALVLGAVAVTGLLYRLERK